MGVSPNSLFIRALRLISVSSTRIDHSFNKSMTGTLFSFPVGVLKTPDYVSVSLYPSGPCIFRRKYSFSKKYHPIHSYFHRLRR